MKGIASITVSLLLAVIQAVMCDAFTDPKNFFPSIKGNLTQIRWAHAVNSQDKLDRALESDVMMLEADVVMGKLKNSTNANDTLVPIMAHPPANTSDLTLESFLKIVIDKNNNGTKKGIKLDFKSIDAFNAAKDLLEKVYNNLKFPVFINADILAGPVNATTTPVESTQFLSGAKTLGNFTLSVGWTTRYGKEENVKEGRYTEEQMQSMINALKEQNISQPITYPVRAGLATGDTNVIKGLMKSSSSIGNEVTLTVWSSKDDEVDAQQLSTLIKDIGVEKVYVDVPEELMNRLQLSGASSVGVAAFTVAASFLFAALLSKIM